MEPSVRVDVVDDVHFVGAALAAVAASRAPRWRLHTVADTWIRYVSAEEDPAEVVVYRAELNDHVPAVLKARALAARGARSIVLTDAVSPAQRCRLREAGAEAILEAHEDIDVLVGVLDGRVRRDDPGAVLPAVRLSDRELQIACLFAGPAAPSAPVLAYLLQLPPASVRTHLQRARDALRAVGEVSTREQLRRTLVDQGWLFNVGSVPVS